MLTPGETRLIAGAQARGCCDATSQLKSPFTKGDTGGCCIQGSELLSPYTS